jgi:hypothetical protein
MASFSSTKGIWHMNDLDMTLIYKQLLIGCELHSIHYMESPVFQHFSGITVKASDCGVICVKRSTSYEEKLWSLAMGLAQFALDPLNKTQQALREVWAAHLLMELSKDVEAIPPEHMPQRIIQIWSETQDESFALLPWEWLLHSNAD